ncbi:hypothetical protein A2U01_0093909 [Trifolium medium]|uniref:Uncharacterized protein n=1 Tax=Trifolium medium TaxID=97028 RepID=A0A392UJM6_9FABA|nr:hypothetical protein [Trifolium medium]
MERKAESFWHLRIAQERTACRAVGYDICIRKVRTSARCAASSRALHVFIVHHARRA